MLQDEAQRDIQSGTTFLGESASMNATSSKFASDSTSFSKKNATDGKKSALFCNYCKKAGHLIDKCFKLHGFPPDFKFTKSKRTAATAEVSESAVPDSSAMVSSPNTLTPEMCSQIMSTIQSTQLKDTVPSSANFAGTFPSIACFSATNNITWIIDSGA